MVEQEFGGALYAYVYHHDTEVVSRWLKVSGCNWRMMVRRCGLKGDQLNTYLECDNQTPGEVLSVNATVLVDDVGYKDERKVSATFYSGSRNVCECVKFSQIPDEHVRYITMRWNFQVFRTVLSSEPGPTFESPEDCGEHDLTLVVGQERKRFFVNKHLLASFSPYFARMFDGQFRESLQSEVEILSENPAQFVVFLRFFYHCPDPISAMSVEFLARMADYFDVKFVADRCERWLISELNKCKPMLLMRIADAYKYQRLKRICFAKVWSVDEVKMLIANEADWSKLSESFRNQILEHLVKSM